MHNKVNIYTSTAAANPHFAKSLLHKYGYVAEQGQPLGTALEQLVAFEGEAALSDIVENSPDKELFFEYFEKKHEKGKKDGTCSCNQKPMLAEAYMNFTGQIQAAQQVAANTQVTRETSLMVLAGAMIIAVAIILKK